MAYCLKKTHATRLKRLYRVSGHTGIALASKRISLTSSRPISNVTPRFPGNKGAIMTMIDRRDTMQKVIDFLKSTDQPVSLSEIVAVLEKRAPERKIREAILELLDTRQAALDDDMRVSTHATAK